MEKQRLAAKHMVAEELGKLKGLEVDTKYEFKRVNGILNRL